MKWSDEEITLILLMIKNGNNYNEISKRINRTPKAIKEKLSRLGENYTKNIKPKYCLNCGKKIPNKNKFCNQSCSAIFNNTRRFKKYKECLTCSKKIPLTNKYCSHKCHMDNNRNKLFEKIENGDLTLPTLNYKKYLLYKNGEKCEECGWSKINPYTNKIPLELEHIDGNYLNNSLENLKILCPSCHSLTKTYKGANIGNGRKYRKKYY
jgi:predicted nucleic acid-binding Zn ribbon protein